MKRSAHTIAIGLLFCSLTAPAWGQEYLYTPQPVDSGEKGGAADGVLVREVEIRRGDTLHDISRTYSGHASYFPQILLFNKISNPDRIYAGTTLKIPVSQSVAATALSESPKHRAKNPSAPKRSMERSEKTTPAPKAASTSMTPGQSPAGPESTTARRLFEDALAAYHKDNCVSALELFDRYLGDNPGAPLAAEASLYKAGCYLKLSVK